MSETIGPWGYVADRDEKSLALLVHVSAFFLPVIGPLVLYVLKRDQSRFVAYHSLQAVVFQLLTALISGATCGVGLLLLVMPLWMGLRAQKGEWAGYPLLESVGR